MLPLMGGPGVCTLLATHNAIMAHTIDLEIRFSYLGKKYPH